jgi:glyoxalase-like protein
MEPLVVDHLLVYGDVDALSAHVATRIGAEPDDGGTHPGSGTRNAIYAAAEARAWELLGPDPAQGAPPSWAPAYPPGGGVLWWWAVRTEEPLEDVRAWLGAQGIVTGEPETGERVRPDGDRVAWELVDPVGHAFGAALPFVIRWTDGTPPWALTAEPVCRIEGFRVGAPDAAALVELFATAGLEIPVDPADAPSLAAELVGPTGRVRFTGP